MHDRHNKILSILSQFHRIEVSRLARLLQVSAVTIRKDLRILKNEGLIGRDHGIVFEHDPIKGNIALASRYTLKHKIAEAAALTVADNETVMIGGGSTCALLAEELIRSKHNLTILLIQYSF
jgi:DeoR/GlpR family transcriptional regulator of sugar metabolism